MLYCINMVAWVVKYIVKTVYKKDFTDDISKRPEYAYVILI